MNQALKLAAAFLDAPIYLTYKTDIVLHQQGEDSPTAEVVINNLGSSAAFQGARLHMDNEVPTQAYDLMVKVTLPKTVNSQADGFVDEVILMDINSAKDLLESLSRALEDFQRKDNTLEHAHEYLCQHKS